MSIDYSAQHFLEHQSSVRDFHAEVVEEHEHQELGVAIGDKHHEVHLANVVPRLLPLDHATCVVLPMARTRSLAMVTTSSAPWAGAGTGKAVRPSSSASSNDFDDDNEQSRERTEGVGVRDSTVHSERRVFARNRGRERAAII
jgi:hypothetical protein